LGNRIKRRKRNKTCSHSTLRLQGKQGTKKNVISGSLRRGKNHNKKYRRDNQPHRKRKGSKKSSWASIRGLQTDHRGAEESPRGRLKREEPD